MQADTYKQQYKQYSMLFFIYMCNVYSLTFTDKYIYQIYSEIIWGFANYVMKNIKYLLVSINLVKEEKRWEVVTHWLTSECRI